MPATRTGNPTHAERAGLRYVTDADPGIRRVRSGSGYRDLRTDGTAASKRDRLRIRSLVIPPAWENVWISPHANGHFQATGTDARGRKQYRYHPDWRTAWGADKYRRMIAFGRALSGIRRCVQRDLARPALDRRAVLALVVRLLETTLIRVGNEEYARTNGSFGLTTMRDRHAAVDGGEVRFRFRGKSGVWHLVSVKDRRLAAAVKRCRDVPGEELFQYLDADGGRHRVTSADVNEYLQEVSGENFTAKDFRTWAGTVLAARALKEFEGVDSATAANRNIVSAIETVARQLGNTRTVCRKCYVHPAVLEAYFDGTLVDTLTPRADRALKSVGNLRPEEAAVLVLLRRRLKAAG